MELPYVNSITASINMPNARASANLVLVLLVTHSFITRPTTALNNTSMIMCKAQLLNLYAPMRVWPSP